MRRVRSLRASKLTFSSISLKWKPPSENTIDFKLVLRFPPHSRRSNEPDYLAKPIFALHAFTGGKDNYEPFDELYVEDDEWEECVSARLEDKAVLAHDSFLSG